MAIQVRFGKNVGLKIDDNFHFIGLDKFMELLQAVQGRWPTLAFDSPPKEIVLHPNDMGNLAIYGMWDDGPDYMGYVDLGMETISWHCAFVCVVVEEGDGDGQEEPGEAGTEEDDADE